MLTRLESTSGTTEIFVFFIPLQLSIGCAHRGLGEIYHSQKNRKLGNKHFQEAIKAFEEANDCNGIQEVLTMMQSKEG